MGKINKKCAIEVMRAIEEKSQDPSMKLERVLALCHEAGVTTARGEAPTSAPPAPEPQAEKESASADG